ncbi:MAG: tetraacyldisaccharide 4'-kinase [Bacteroidia bacterium]|nr:tetraacyldisaccharide 4'-kinase [Bacteroidia bacterium]
MRKAWRALKRLLRTFGVILAIPLAIGYGILILLRNRLYHWGWLPSRKLPCLVIGIGNLSMGGSGKTPFSIYLLRWLLERGVRVAYLSRGYKRISHGFQEVLLSGADPARYFGDEATLVKSLLPNIPVGVCEDRVKGGIELLKRYPDIQAIVLDDAFQHRRIQKDVDILILDLLNPPWRDWLFPLGRLREPFMSYKRADLLILNQKTAASLPTTRRFNRPSLTFHYVTEGLVPAFPELPPLSLDELRYRNVVAFCGIAHPQSFYQSLSALGVYILYTRSFPDHYSFSQKDTAQIARRYRSARRTLNMPSLLLLTTEKDLIRLSQSPALSAFTGLPLYALRIGMQPLHPEKADSLFSTLFASLLLYDHNRSL